MGMFASSASQQQAPVQLSQPRKPSYNEAGGLHDYINALSGRLMAIGGIQSGAQIYSDAQQRIASAGKPRLQQIGDTLLTIDPVTGQPTVAFDGRKPAAPHYWETNDGSLGMIGPDGKPTIAYKDPTPKQGVVAIDNADGTKTLYPTVNGVPVGMTPGGGAAMPNAGAIPLQNGALPPGFKLRSGGAAPAGQRPFP